MSSQTIDKQENFSHTEPFDDLVDVVGRLTESETVLKAELQQLAGRTSQVSDRLKQVQTALAALRGQHTQSSAKAAPRSRKNAATPATIGPLVESILRDRGPIPQTELLSQLKQQLLSQGLTRVGVRPVMAKTLASPRFKIDSNGDVSFA